MFDGKPTRPLHGGGVLQSDMGNKPAAHAVTSAVTSAVTAVTSSTQERSSSGVLSQESPPIG